MARWLRLERGQVDLEGRTLHRGEEEVHLSELEARVLAFLAGRPHEPVSRRQLLEQVWGFGNPAPTRAVDNVISRLRARIEVDRRDPAHIRSVRGVGYVFVPAAAGATGGVEGRFFGRTAELERLSAELRDGQRAITVLGVPGIGKTRLVRQWLEGGAAGSATWVDLHASDDVVDVVLATAAALGVPVRDEPPPRRIESVGLFLRRTPRLIVLDAVDGAAPGCAAVVARWLAASPGLNVVATSRQTLGLPVEAVVEMQALPESQAVAMLADRAPHPIRPRVAAAFLERVQGHPRAIEIAAPVLAAHALPDVLARVDGAMHRSLAPWWARIPGSAREAVGIAAWVHDDAPVELIARAASSAGVQRALDSGWLRLATPGRVRMESVLRRFTRARESPGPRLAEVVLEHLVEHGARTWGPGSKEALAELGRWIPTVQDLAGATEPGRLVDLVLALGPAMLLSEAASVDLVEHALTHAVSPEQQQRARLLLGASLHQAGRAAEAIPYLSEPAPCAAAERKMRLGYALASVGRFEEGLGLLDEAAGEATGAMRAHVATRIGSVRHLLGDVRGAREALRQAFDLHQDAEDVAAEARTLGNLALFDVELGEHARAEVALRRVLAWEQDHGARQGAVQLRLDLAGLLHVDGRAEEALVEYTRARDEAVALDASMHAAIGWFGVGVTSLELDQRLEARRCLGRARVGFSRGRHPVWQALTLAWIALLDHIDGDEVSAESTLERARATPGAHHPTVAILLDLVTARCRGQALAPHLERARESAATSSGIRLACRLVGEVGSAPKSTA